MGDQLPRPEPRDAFRRALRSQLMAQAPSVLARRETAWTRILGGFQGGLLRPAFALGVILLLLIGTAGKAAADSLPGDAVFPLKRAAEQLQLALALDDTTTLRVLAEQADHRLAELAESISARKVATPIAQREYAEAVAKLTTALARVRGQHGVSEDKKNAVDDIVDAVRTKHTTVLQELEQHRGAADDAEQQDIERAKEASDKLRPSERPERSPEQSEQPERSRTPQPTRTAQPTRTPGIDGERTATPVPSVRR